MLFEQAIGGNVLFP